MAFEDLDALAWVRARPRQFFGADEVDVMRLLAFVMTDMLSVGGGRCVIQASGGSWVIASDRDWLLDGTHAPTELFRSVVSPASEGRHAMRSEIVVTGFASSVAIADSEGATLIQGDTPSSDVWASVAPFARALAFQL